jgi:hypothetical protein
MGYPSRNHSDNKKFLEEKLVEATKQKEEKRKNPQ